MQRFGCIEKLGGFLGISLQDIHVAKKYYVVIKGRTGIAYARNVFKLIQ